MLYIMLIFVIVVLILEKLFTNKKTTETEEIKENNTNLSNYMKKDYVMTQTELIFYRELKKITDKLELSIFPQVNLERIINVKENKNADRNRIKSRSIDYTIVNNKNCRIVCCIELDDYTHNYQNRTERDNFINELFDSVGIKLHRVKVSNYYNIEELENKIKESL